MLDLSFDDAFEMCALVAPLRNVNVGDFIEKPIEDQHRIRNAFFRNALEFMELCGLHIDTGVMNVNVGAYKDGSGARIVELSNAFFFSDVCRGKVDLFAALMADFGYEHQEATVSVEHLHYGDPACNAIEYRIYLNHTKGVDVLVKNSGVGNLSFNDRKQSFHILADKDAAQDKVLSLLRKIKEIGAYRDYVEMPVRCRYFDILLRRKIYASCLENRDDLFALVNKGIEGASQKGREANFNRLLSYIRTAV